MDRHHDLLEGWRRAERAAAEAEEAARVAAREKSADQKPLAAKARSLRTRAYDVWRDFLGSSLAPLAPALPVNQAARIQGPDADLKSRIDEWRRAQARAHAAEVRAVRALERFVQGIEDEAPAILQSEASMLRQETAVRLERVYSTARQLRPPRG